MLLSLLSLHFLQDHNLFIVKCSNCLFMIRCGNQLTSNIQFVQCCVCSDHITKYPCSFITKLIPCHFIFHQNKLPSQVGLFLSGLKPQRDNSVKFVFPFSVSLNALAPSSPNPQPVIRRYLFHDWSARDSTVQLSWLCISSLFNPLFTFNASHSAFTPSSPISLSIWSTDCFMKTLWKH